MSCFQWLKDTKNESKSQHDILQPTHANSCFQWLKDTKNESKSQPSQTSKHREYAVSNGSKILK